MSADQNRDQPPLPGKGIEAESVRPPFNHAALGQQVEAEKTSPGPQAPAPQLNMKGPGADAVTRQAALERNAESLKNMYADRYKQQKTNELSRDRDQDREK